MPHPVDEALLVEADKLRAEFVKAGVSADALPSDQKIARFIKVNGLWWVMAACRIAARRIADGEAGALPKVTEPWDYLKAVTNGRPARATYLYLMLNLWESALRARVDLELTVAKGANWYHNPRDYMSDGHLEHLRTEQPGLFVDPTTADPVIDTTKFNTARKFLGALYLTGLHNIVQEAWDRRFRKRLLHPSGAEVLATQLNKWLRDAYDARKEVAHVAPITNTFFRQSTDSLRNLLELLEFDVDKTINAIEARDPHKEDFDLLP
jgi:hypothetical protein